MSEAIPVGVVGVGSMGVHHARVYAELPGVDLVGVYDVDEERAAEVAQRFDTSVLDRETLLDRAIAVSVAVPTEYHHSVGMEALEAGTNVIIEKPFVSDPEDGRELIAAARRYGLVLQVGHIERYNPAILALEDVLVDADPIAFATRRQGPPVDRDGTDSVVFDLMIHDIDVVRSLADGSVTAVSAAGVADGDHVVARFEFDDGLVATLTASRVTQKRIRDLAITAADCQIDVDYMDQSVQIHRHSLPEYVASNGDVRYRHESIIERPTVENGEPLKNELSEFVEVVREDGVPRTSGIDGLEAVQIARRIEDAAKEESEPESVEVPNP